MTHDESPGTALVVGFAPDVSADERRQHLERARRAVAVREPSAPIHESLRRDVVVLTTRRPVPLSGVFPLTTPISPTEEGRLAPSARMDLEQDRVFFHVDPVALASVYHAQGRRYGAISTSSFALAALRESGLNDRAWAHLALLGFQIGDATPFDGVTRLVAGTSVGLHRGRLAFRAEDGPAGPGSGPPPLRRIVTAMLDEHPDLSLELSGGLDSRVILAAIPPGRRSGLTTMTIGSPDSEDVIIAQQIAHDEQLDHVVLSDWYPVASDPGEARRRCEAAAIRYECQTNVLTSAALMYIEEQAPTGARFTGVNGEYLRGFYYPGTFNRTPVSREAVGRLVRWRLVTNDRVAPNLFVEEWWRDRRERLVDEVTERLEAHSPRLRTATDEFYLYERVARWAGPSYTEASRHRAVLAPFLHPDFLAAARGIDPRIRAGSRELARILQELDPRLAARPLAGGIRPIDLAGRGPFARARRTRATGGKVIRKVAQRLAQRVRPPTGATTVLQQLHATWELGSPVRNLDGVPFLRPEALERLHEHPESIDAATASFLVNLSVAIDALRQATTVPAKPNSPSLERDRGQRG